MRKLSKNDLNNNYRKLVTSSRMKGIPELLIKKYCEFEGWRNTCKGYNRAYYYDPRKVRRIFNLLTDDDIHSLKAEGYDDDYLEPSDLAVKALEHYKKNKKIETIYENYTVYWINWPSSLSEHKKPQFMKEDNCRVVVKGQTATVFLKDGILKKKLITNGFTFIPRK